VLAPRGRLVVFAPLPGKTPVYLLKVLTKELEIVGAVNDDDLFDGAMAALEDPALALAELVTHRFPIEEYRQAFALAERGHDRAMKVAIVFPEP
jgi:threonine dehydrogenase-like Zn-dependent dehydrogenase